MELKDSISGICPKCNNKIEFTLIEGTGYKCPSCTYILTNKEYRSLKSKEISKSFLWTIAFIFTLLIIVAIIVRIPKATHDQLPDSLTGTYKNVNDYNQTINIDKAGNFLYKYQGGICKGTFSIGDKKTYSSGNWTYPITGYKVSETSGDGCEYFGFVNWGPEYMTEIGFTQRGVTGPSPCFNIFFVDSQLGKVFVK